MSFPAHWATSYGYREAEKAGYRKRLLVRRREDNSGFSSIACLTAVTFSKPEQTASASKLTTENSGNLTNA